MGIYSRKRKKSGFRVFILTLFVLSIFIVLAYYFFYPYNLKTVLDENLSNKVVESQDEVEIDKVSETSENEYFQSEIDIDLSNYLEKSDLHKSIKDFIQNNPKFIIDVLSKYQDEQNKIEQEKTSQLNNLNIISLNLFDNPMIIGNKNASKIIYEFVDYNCGYCLKFHQQVSSVLNEDLNTKLVIMQMPILGENSITLSKIAIAASFQNKFEDVHNYLYSSKTNHPKYQPFLIFFQRNKDSYELL